MNKLIVTLVTSLLLVAACSNNDEESGPTPYASRYVPLASTATLLSNATVQTGTGERLDNTDVLLADGKVMSLGEGLDPGDAVVVDASGMWITPGIINVPSHLGVYASPGTESRTGWPGMLRCVQLRFHPPRFTA